MKRSILLSFFIFSLFHVQAQIWVEVQKIVASDRNTNDHFSSSVSISGNRAIVGALDEDHNVAGTDSVNSAGSVYFFEQGVNGLWEETQKVVAPDRDESDLYGFSVSISGDYAVVSTPYEDQDEFETDSVDDAGSAYIYERDGSGQWNLVKKITSFVREENDFFGYSAAIDGNYLIIGSRLEDEDAAEGDSLSQAGAAYIFERDSSGNWNGVQKIVASDRANGDEFGYSVSISGNYVLVGAPRGNLDEGGIDSVSNAGCAYIFERDSSGTWNEVDKLDASDRETEDYFSISLAINSDYAIVGAYLEDQNELGLDSMNGAGSAYIFEKDSSGNWNEVKKIVSSDRGVLDLFGDAVAIHGDFAVVGARKESEDALGANTLSNTGSAYLFERDGNGQWNQVEKIVASDRQFLAWNGYDVAIEDKNVLISARGQDFDESGGNYLSRAGAFYFYERIGSPTQVSGKVYKVDNGNCLLDSSEIGIAGILIKASPANHYTITDENGDFTINLDTGEYQLSQIIPSSLGEFMQDCPSGPDYHILSFDTASQDTSGLDFANSITPCAFLSVDVTSNRRRLCGNSYTIIQYCNKGYGDTAGVKVYLHLPQYVDFINANHAYTQDSSGNYIFDIDTLLSGECGTIRVTDKVHCNAGLLGLTQCTKVWITPANGCESIDPSWDKSSMAVTGMCRSDSIAEFEILNTGDAGNGDMASPNQFRVYADADLILIDSFLLEGGESLVIQVISNGQTIRLEADQHPLHPGRSHPNDVVEGCNTDTAGGISIGYVDQQFTDDADVFTEMQCMPIQGSFDPNDKTVSPKGITENKYVKPGTQLDYVIRFQNTGTDTAYRVVVRDELPPELDLSTIVFGNSSHPYTIEVNGVGNPVFDFVFDSIYLVDSTTDLLNSMGFIKFKIDPLPGLSNGTVINNEAAIYFDFNPPIITNDAWITIFDTSIIGSGTTIMRCDSALPPILNFNTQDTLVCPGASVQLMASGGDYYYWFSGDSINDRTISNPVVSSAESETFWVEVYAQTSCESTTDSVQVNIHEIPTGDSINPISCYSYISPSGNFTWDSSGIYLDTLVSAALCDSIITINLTIETATSSTIDTSVCESYTSPSGNYIYDSGGVYYDTIPNAAMCDSVITINLTITTIDTMLTSLGLHTWQSNEVGASYQWLNVGMNTAITGETTDTYQATKDGTYAVEITKNGCVDTSTIFEAIGILGIIENTFGSDLSIYPNPTTGQLTLDLGSIYTDVKVSVVNFLGQTIQQNRFGTVREMDINIEGSSGYYLIEIQTAEGKAARVKVLKE